MEKVHLSNAEWEIMNILWKFPEATITQIVAELNKKKFWDMDIIGITRDNEEDTVFLAFLAEVESVMVYLLTKALRD